MRRRQFFENDKDFFAGIEFIGDKEIDLNDGLDFITLQENFKVLEINKYFSVNKNELNILKCKPNTLVNLKWEILVTSKEKISLSFRILQNKKIIDSLPKVKSGLEKGVEHLDKKLNNLNEVIDKKEKEVKEEVKNKEKNMSQDSINYKKYFEYISIIFNYLWVNIPISIY
jgi:hypothetical protein